MTTTDSDVVIVGASLAGCAAAIHYGRRGARVALLDRNPDPRAYKVVCSTYIQAGATPAIQRLGLAERIEAAGGVRNGIDIWTRWGWIRPQPGGAGPATHGYNIRRETLDPMLREMAAETPGVELMLGHTARGLLMHGRRATGVETTGPAGGRSLSARLVVAADGRGSRVAELAGLPASAGRTAASRTSSTTATCRSPPAAGPRCGCWSPTAPTRSRTTTASRCSRACRRTSAAPSSSATPWRRWSACSRACRRLRSSPGRGASRRPSARST